MRSAEFAKSGAEFRPNIHHGGHRKRLNSATVIDVGLKRLVYGDAGKAGPAVIVGRAIRSFRARVQELGWLIGAAYDIANAE